MTNNDIQVEKLDGRVMKVENQVSELTANFNGLVRELKDFKEEMRQQNQMRAEEIREIRQEMLNRDNQRAEEMREIRVSLQSMQSSGHNLNIVTIMGVAAIVIAVLLK